MATSAHDVYAFNTISDFVCNLYDVFGKSKNQHGKALRLYYHLIKKISNTNQNLIKKNIAAFTQFCTKNRDAFASKTLHIQKVNFSDKIYVHIGFFLKNSDSETQNVIWEFLYTLSALLDPKGNGKQLLDNFKNNPQPSKPQLSDMMTTMGPMMEQMLSNPNFGGMLSALSSSMGVPANSIPDLSSINMPELMKSMQGVMGTVVETLEKSDDPNIKQLLNLSANPNPVLSQSLTEVPETSSALETEENEQTSSSDDSSTPSSNIMIVEELKTTDDDIVFDDA